MSNPNKELVARIAARLAEENERKVRKHKQEFRTQIAEHVRTLTRATKTQSVVVDRLAKARKAKAAKRASKQTKEN